MTDWYEARRIAHRAAPAEPPQMVSIAAALGRTTAVDVTALHDVPHYVSSAMDGWAVAGPPPWRIRAAGRIPSTPLGVGEAATVATGGLIPAGAEYVLRSESGVKAPDGSDAQGSTMRLEPRPHVDPHELAPGRHLRGVGTEARAGETLMTAGTRLGPVQLAVLAGSGHDTVCVQARVPTALVLTGDEVIGRGIPAPGQVRDSFGVALPGVLAALGADVASCERAPDSLDATIAALERAAPAPLVVTTGGTGFSPADQLRPALRALRAEMLVDGVAMRPGSPALLARLPDGRLVLALPGNPLAALLVLLSLAPPFIAGLCGDPLPSLGRVSLARTIGPSRAALLLRPYRLAPDGAVPTEWHGSGMLRGLAEADGVLVCPGGGAQAGTVLETLPVPW